MLKAKPDKAQKGSASWQSVQDKNRKLPAGETSEGTDSVVAKDKANKAKAGARWESEGGKTK